MEIHVEMGLLFHVYYVTSPKYLFALNRMQKFSFNKFYYIKQCIF